MRKIGIIGGSGVENPALMQGFKKRNVKTPYGIAACNVGEIFGNKVVFVSRHGSDHSLNPTKVHFRANIWALKKLGVQEVFATTAVGSLNPKMKPGHFVVCDNIIDFTRTRNWTFYDTPERGVVHVDFTNPYCDGLRAKAIACLKDLGAKFHKKGVYVCTEGPRFETSAEVKMFAKLGGDVVGMTQMPEAYLAREAEMCYVNVSIVTNMGAGIAKEPLSHAEVLAEMEESKKTMQKLLQAFIAYEEKPKKNKKLTAVSLYNGGKAVEVEGEAVQAPAKPEPYDCICLHALKDFGGFKL